MFSPAVYLEKGPFEAPLKGRGKQGKQNYFASWFHLGARRLNGRSERKASGPKGGPELQKAKQDGDANSPLQRGEAGRG
jgi:hypothetical protein